MDTELGRDVADYQLDGNHTIASRSRHRWRKQFNVLVAYASFYNPFRAFKVLLTIDPHWLLSARTRRVVARCVISNQKSKDSGCLSLRPLLALIRLFSAIHCGREGHLVRLSLAIERASCLVVPSRAKTVRSNEDPLPLLTALKWNSEGLIPAIVQEVESGEVLMMAWMDQAALRKTLEVGQTHFYSRSRRSLWHKGATSGHVQAVESIHVDCDADVLLVKIRQQGGACHEGYHSCFFRRVNEAGALEVVETPIFDAETVYAQDRIESRPEAMVP